MIPTLSSPLKASSPRLCRGLAAYALALTAVSLAPGQQTPAAPASSQPEDAIVLGTFEIREESENPYQSRQALSASRVATPIENIPQTISVVTNEFIQDSLSLRMLDAAKYITPVVESTLPIGGDRYMIRGFQVSHEFIDGTEISGQDGYSASLMPYNVERIEIIKGPNAILVPGGSPGGQFNPITKSPLTRNQSSLTLELAQYYGTGVSADVNRVLNPDATVAGRLVLAYWDSDGYTRGQYRKGYMWAPSIMWQLGDAHKLVLKAEFMQNRETTLVGLPIDPAVGSDDYARIAPGIPRNFSFGNRDDSRHRGTERITAELHSKLGNHVNSRLQLMANHVVREDRGGTSAAITGINITRNPSTGKYEPGTVWTVDESGANAVPTATAAPLPDPSTYVFSRSNGAVDLFYNEMHLRNDYSLKLENNWIKSSTVGGVAANFSKVQFKVYPAVNRGNVAAGDLDEITFPKYNFAEPTATNGGANRTGRQVDAQFYLYESASFLEERLILSGGVSRFFGELTRTDNTGLPPAITYPSYNLSTTAESYGIVVKPVRQVSLFASKNTSGGTMPSSLNPGTYAPDFRAASGEQLEYGVKVATSDNRFTASFAYFDIEQQNYPVPNSEYYTLIALGRIEEANALPNPLYLNLNSKGWEFEMTYALNKHLFIVGNVTDFEIRQPITNVRVRSVPDTNGALYLDYRFTDGRLAGFGVNIGVDYKSDVAGENATGFTTSKPLADGSFVANQPTFLVAGRTLVNLGFTYRAETWTGRIQLNNLLDKDYILAAGSRTAAVPGDPFSIKGSVSYRF